MSVITPCSTTELKLRRVRRLQGEIQRLQDQLSPLLAELGLDPDIRASRVGDRSERLC